MTAAKYTYQEHNNSEPDYTRKRIISAKTERKLFKFHWYAEYMLIGMAAFISITKTVDLFIFDLPDYFIGINLDFLVALLGILTGLFLAKKHASKLNTPKNN